MLDYNNILQQKDCRIDIRWLAKTIWRQKLVGSIYRAMKSPEEMHAIPQSQHASARHLLSSCLKWTLPRLRLLLCDPSSREIAACVTQGSIFIKGNEKVWFCFVCAPSRIINVLPSLVNELDESETCVLLQRVLPFLRAEEHNQFHDRVAVLKCG